HSPLLLLFSLMPRPPPKSTLFPYTTLFRSKLSSDAHDLDRSQFKSVLRHGIEASLFIGLPASIGMIVVRYPAVRLLFQHGNFTRSEEHTSELQSPYDLVCRLLLEKKKKEEN